jgi:epoxyqueuosine reductase QueG
MSAIFSSQEFTREIKATAIANGAALVGVAAIESIPPCTPPLPVSKVMPEAQRVVVFAIPMLRGSIESPSLFSAMISTHATYKEEEILELRLGRLLEERGYLAAMIVPASPIEMSRETKGLLGDISLRHAAVGAGLGTIGKSRLLLTRKWGPRVRLGAVVTNAPLEADRPTEERVCDNCDLCVQSCPAQALNTHTLKDAAKCLGKQMKWGMVAHIQFMQKLLEAPMEQQKEMLRSPEYWNIYQAQSVALLYTCYECVNCCPVGR